MFFWLIGSDPESTKWAEFLEGLDNLGESGHKGDHLILGDRRVLSAISGLPELSRRSKAYFKSASSRMTSLGAVRTRMPCVQVSPDIHGSVLEGSQWTVPLSHFSIVHSTECSHLLAEHVYDLAVLKALGDWQLRNLNIKRMAKIRLRGIVGGGGGSHHVLRIHQLNPATIGICVVDSDKGHINDKLGNTASSCADVFESSWKWRLSITPSRELENLVPSEFWVRSLGKSPVYFDRSHDDAYWPIYGFIDIKIADCIFRFLDIPKSNNSYATTQAALRALSLIAHPCRRCIDDSRCSGHTCQTNEAAPDSLRKLAEWLELNNTLPAVNGGSEHLSALANSIAYFGVGASFPMI